ncbi:hypothetical protein Emag_003076 [Eimeria magna]
MAEPKADTRISTAPVETSMAEAPPVVCGRVKDKLKCFEQMKRFVLYTAGKAKNEFATCNRRATASPTSALRFLNEGVEHADSGAFVGKRVQRIPNAVSLRVSEKKVRELESALRHREELIRSLEGTIAQRESDLSFVLKEKFQLSKTIVASRSAAQPCNANTLPGVQQLSSADTVADSVGSFRGDPAYSAPIGSSHGLSTLPRSRSQKHTCRDPPLCEEAVQGGLNDKIAQEAQACEAPREVEFEEESQSHKSGNTEVIASEAKEDDVSLRRGTQLRFPHDVNSLARAVAEGNSSEEERVVSLTPIARQAQWGSRSEGTAGGSPLLLDDDLGSAGSTALLTATSTEQAFVGRRRASLEDATAYLNNNRWRLKADECGRAAPPPIHPPSPIYLVGLEEKEPVGQDFGFTAAELLHSSESAGESEGDVSNLTRAPPRDVKAADPANAANSLRVQTQARIEAEAETSDVLALHEGAQTRVYAVFKVSVYNMCSYIRDPPIMPSVTDTEKSHGHDPGKLQTTLDRIEKFLRETAVHRCHSGCRSNAEFVAIQEELKQTQRQLVIMEQRCRILEEIDSRIGRKEKAPCRGSTVSTSRR